VARETGAILSLSRCGRGILIPARRAFLAQQRKEGSTRRRGTDWGKLGSIGLFVGVVIFGPAFLILKSQGVFDGILSTPKPAPAAPTAYPDWQLEGVGEAMLKQSLRDPDSYQFIGWTKYENTLAGVVIPPPFTVHGLKYRAKNGFGGYDVGEQIYIFGPKGVVPYSDKK
jgi:hypothetical protein